jgi:hypothetical protein
MNIVHLLRGFIYTISIFQIIMYFFAGQNDLIQENIFLDIVSDITLLTLPLFVVVALILLVYNIYKPIKEKNAKLLVFLLPDCVLPLFSGWIYDVYFSQILY